MLRRLLSGDIGASYHKSGARPFALASKASGQREHT
jgi:hypothetical protein